MFIIICKTDEGKAEGALSQVDIETSCVKQIGIEYICVRWKRFCFKREFTRIYIFLKTSYEKKYEEQ